MSRLGIIKLFSRVLEQVAPAERPENAYFTIRKWWSFDWFLEGLGTCFFFCIKCPHTSKFLSYYCASF